MKLEDWANNKYRLDGVGEKDLHVIGTCGDCKYWLEDTIPKAEGWGECLSPSVRRIKANFNPPVEHGCIHWEQKE